MSEGDISGISDISDIILMNQSIMKRRCFYELRPHNTKRKIR